MCPTYFRALEVGALWRELKLPFAPSDDGRGHPNRTLPVLFADRLCHSRVSALDRELRQVGYGPRVWGKQQSLAFDYREDLR